MEAFRHAGIEAAIEEEHRYLKLQLKDEDFRQAFGIIRKWGFRENGTGIFRGKNDDRPKQPYQLLGKRAKY